MATLLTCSGGGPDCVLPNTVSTKRAAIETAISDSGVFLQLFAQVLKLRPRHKCGVFEFFHQLRFIRGLYNASGFFLIPHIVMYPSYSTFASSARAVAVALCVLNTVAFSADWVGNVNSQFGVAANWQGGTFAAGIANARAENFYILNESLSALRYTEADGETIVGVPDGKAGQFVVGLADRSGRLEISGGALRIYSYWSAIVAQLGTNTVGTIHVSGGVLRISNTSRTLDKERFFRVGNTASAKQSAKGAIFLSGGALIVECAGGPEVGLPASSERFLAGGLNIGRCGGSGLVYITGGVLRVTSPLGTSFVPDDGPAAGIMMIGLGNGVFEQTNSSRLTFGKHPQSDAYITFNAGSDGAISLAGATREIFDGYIKDGYIRIEGGVADPANFRFDFENGRGVLRLASSKGRLSY
jgi:hypothetical protein